MAVVLSNLDIDRNIAPLGTRLRGRRGSCSCPRMSHHRGLAARPKARRCVGTDCFPPEKVEASRGRLLLLLLAVVLDCVGAAKTPAATVLLLT